MHSRPMWIVLGAFMVLPPLASGLPPSAEEVFLKEIHRLEEEFGGHLGFMARNLATGDSLAYNAHERFPTASVIKLPIMAAFFHEVEEGRVDPAMPVVLAAADKKPGSGLLQMFDDGAQITLLDAVKLMIVVSDNTATNLVLDRLGETHDERMAAVNDYLQAEGLSDTRLLNRLYTWETKKSTPESFRYGIGVSTPADMVALLEGLHRRTICDSSSAEAMMRILEGQFYNDMIPRFLPAETCARFSVAHKTGGIQETKVDVGLVLSDRLSLAMAIFVDKHADHADAVDNRALLLGAHVARAIWNYFTGDSGYQTRVVMTHHVDWTFVPGGRWGIYRSPAAPFPHPDRAGGYTRGDGTFYPPFPHYRDSSIVVFVPESFRESPEGANLIVHFHGHNRDNLIEFERQEMPQTMINERINALLVIPQGPYRAADSFGGKMEEEGGFERMVREVLETMRGESVVQSATPGRIIVSAHSGGYRPAGFVLRLGGLREHITDVFLFDAFYAQQDDFRRWLLEGNGTLRGAYTEHLAEEHRRFQQELGPQLGSRLDFTPAGVSHEEVVRKFFPLWVKELGAPWRAEQ
jgi:beta-lactamase class A